MAGAFQNNAFQGDGAFQTGGAAVPAVVRGGFPSTAKRIRKPRVVIRLNDDDDEQPIAVVQPKPAPRKVDPRRVAALAAAMKAGAVAEFRASERAAFNRISAAAQAKAMAIEEAEEEEALIMLLAA